MHLNAQDECIKDSSIDSNVEQICTRENRSALERDRSM